MKKLFSISFVLLAFSACVKDKPEAIKEPQITLSHSRKTFIINEGNFGSFNASVSLYDPKTAELIENFYNIQNNGSIGDVLQSWAQINGDHYLVVNNSGKITRCDAQLRKKEDITDLNLPRYMLQVTHQKAYVSSLTGNVAIIDLNSGKQTGEIICRGWTEKMLMIYHKVFVTNLKSNYVYVINTTKDQIEDSVYVGLFSGDLLSDKFDKIWLLRGKEYGTSNQAKLYRIDPLSHEALSVYTFSQEDAPFNLCFNRGKDTLYYINSGIFKMPISDKTLPQQPFIAQDKRNYYGLGINPRDNRIYVSDAMDYSQKSNIYIYSPSGVQENTFKAGINSNGFYFE